MDDVDKQILDCLQEDATMPRPEIAERVHLSTTPCWRRIQKLRETGIIRKEVALLDRRALNVGLTAFVAIRTNQHNPEWFRRFADAVRDIPEIVECYRMSGEVDYLLRVVIPGVDAYDGVYNRLIRAVELVDVTSSFAMEELKYSTALPLEYVSDDGRWTPGPRKPTSPREAGL